MPWIGGRSLLDTLVGQWLLLSPSGVMDHYYGTTSSTTSASSSGSSSAQNSQQVQHPIGASATPARIQHPHLQTRKHPTAAVSALLPSRNNYINSSSSSSSCRSSNFSSSTSTLSTLSSSSASPSSEKFHTTFSDVGDGDGNGNDKGKGRMSLSQQLIHPEVIPRWPIGCIPVEIFELITSYMTRSEIKKLRLVCREFEAKVSAQYFRNVVVPFRSELYNSLSRDENGTMSISASSLFSNGMRIFESFGPHILRFALSLELDEDSLAFPPVKPIQEAVPAFWGVYRWPHETYHRYTDLEDLEQTADETEGMKQALKCLSKVSNLGLCCDAGLGFLIGPDVAARKATVSQPVFDVHDWRQRLRLKKKTNPVVTVADFKEAAKEGDVVISPAESYKRKVLEKMVIDAGFEGSQIEEAIHLLLYTESATLGSIDFDERPAKSSDRDRRHSFVQFGAQLVEMETEQDNDNENDANRHPLIPTSLTRPQKELLLELEWAHRAMIQSYVIGIIDNANDGCFYNLTTLTIAKIPSCHVHILYRDQLWNCFPNLKNVSLGVIADWRKLSKPTPGYVEDTSVSPVAAVSKVYKLLNDYIGKQPAIESIRFEWICGGEFAPSSYQRNQYVLPAPLVPNPELMASPSAVKDEAARLIELPYIKHLFLKNCWASPHVLTETIRQMALSSLEKLEFESFSLSGPPTTTPQASMQIHALGHAVHGAHHHHHHQHHHHHLHNPHLNLFNPTGPSGPTFQPGGAMPPEMGDKFPEFMSWAGFMDHFNPGLKIRDSLSPITFDPVLLAQMLAQERKKTLTSFIPKVSKLITDEELYKLQCISFKSCGYICVDAPYVNTRSILPTDGTHGATYFLSHRNDMSGSMQHCRDRLLGRIVSHIKGSETKFLEGHFEMELGWEGIYDEQIIEDAIADGIDCPGSGRFSGILESPDEPRKSHWPAAIPYPFVPAPLPAR